MRVQAQPAFVLHARPWRETSLIVELLSRDHGRVAVVARGAQGARRHPLRAALQPLQHLRVDFLPRGELARLLQAEAVDAAPLARARRQIEVRELRALERPARRLETAALELFALGRVRPRAETLAALTDIDAMQVRDAFAGMLQGGAAVAVSGRVKRGLDAPLRERLAPLLRH